MADKTSTNLQYTAVHGPTGAKPVLSAPASSIPFPPAGCSPDGARASDLTSWRLPRRVHFRYNLMNKVHTTLKKRQEDLSFLECVPA